jgi:plasmid stabilization system protein ParE
VSAHFREGAEEERYEAAAFYEGPTNGLGDRFLDDGQSCVDRILQRPQVGRRVGERCRVVLAKRFPFSVTFSVIYAVQEATIIIVAVAHQRCRPGYWSDRYAR